MSETFTLQQMTQPRATSPRRRRWPLAALAVVVLLAGAAAAWFVVWPAVDREHVARPAGTVGAVAACHEAVKLRLKAPGTAQFGGEQTQGDGGPTTAAIVTGWVDAQNGFGAMVRSRYWCKAFRGDSVWRVDDATFSDW